MISYEVPMVIALLVPTMLAGSMGTVAIVEAQRGMWFIVLAPIAAILFFISSMAEAGKAPFDLLEAESEIVAGLQHRVLVDGLRHVLRRRIPARLHHRRADRHALPRRLARTGG